MMKQGHFKYKEIEKYASDCQIAADEIAFKYIDKDTKHSKLSILQNYCNFNVFHTIGLFGWKQPAVSFVIKNGKDLKRKFELNEFFDFLELYRRKSLTREINSFEDIKRQNQLNV